MWHQNMVRTKKWHVRCSLACSSGQLLKQSEIANGATVAESRKMKGDDYTVYYCAMFYQLNA